MRAFLIAFFIFFCVVLILEYYRIYFYAWIAGFPYPKYRITVKKNVMLAMQDGVKLSADVYLPKVKRKFPVIIIRTPYNKRGSLHPYRQLASLFASQGYVFIVQDVRGKFASEGEFFPYATEALDGHITVMWAGEAPWSNGNVALFGFSYLGSCAWLAARYKSPYLRTIIPMFTTQNTYSIWIDYGIPFFKAPLYWLTKYTKKKDDNSVTHTSIEPYLWQLPINDLDYQATKQIIPFYRQYLEHVTPDEFWEKMSAHHYIDNLNIPVFIIGGWYDPFLTGTIEDYQRMKHAHPASKNHQSILHIGPWAHNPAQKFKGVDFGKEANFNSLMVQTLNWCDTWLKGNTKAMNDQNKIRYFVMGRNEWREAQDWPPPEITYEKYYLNMDGTDLNYRNGILTFEPSPTIIKSRYIYNPRDPVLFRGRYLLDSEGWTGPVNQEDILARNDVLMYTTAPFQEELIIAGNVELILYVSSEAVDTDFCVKICDVHTDGEAYSLATGFLRMRYRESLEKPKMMVPGEIYRVEISLRSVAIAFLKDHCLQLQITSSDFPVHNRNLNTGKSCEFSTEIREVEQTVYTGGHYPSHLILPVLKS